MVNKKQGEHLIQLTRTSSSNPSLTSCKSTNSTSTPHNTTFRKLSFFQTSFLDIPSYKHETPETNSLRSPLEKFSVTSLPFLPKCKTMKVARDWMEGYAQHIDGKKSE